jgi:pteridine reductase
MGQPTHVKAAPDCTQRPVVWVTGSGAKRVGQSIAREFAASGYRIAIHAHRSAQQAEEFRLELQQKGVDAMVVLGGLDEEGFAEQACQQILDRFGRIDVLVNSAAIWDWKRLEDVTVSDLKHQFDINTLGTFLCCQKAGLVMAQQESGGSIILIGDWAVSRPYPMFASYFVGKGAIETMTRSLAVELGTRNPNIRVNAILPGPVMLDPSIEPSKAKRLIEESLLKRLGTPEDVARAARFLAEQPFITGVSLPVDGGRSIHSPTDTDAIAHPTYPHAAS